ncbi:hypothetical protein COW94_04415 [Candidatus Peregrinibacteria bacterium CG22_combo_CG10-13_8_21_14_all_44_10]|nr:MAG: hypothetical protein AUK45_01190 [Candidatus Peregrinibacteria bacterium CG2_30_44_17]PIP65947.1 MAG: hypothetical protein COW94_04415 [Candidatus Peregrinibacteria bacterium CG22_combo_CG10-13_8_21_14_all_44_10]PIS04162.1 MAG: hypothetical protein COT83_02140 [Candidatus Peregrinibacteria bacterium CG10_big_fil_rev_8_21_14_0_10_44_7]PIX79834.1 MAG: hypothetical protein COZ35_02515 [Candidatus Peregrinibacteria bacterium CG_4_10_14_3_um_filter_44_21]PJB89154.1 MAG: hypothetical protein 
MTERNYPHDTTLLQWKAPEYVKYQKGPIWTTIAGSMTAALIAYGILSGSWSMAAAFLALSLAYYVQHKQEPREVIIEITELGIKAAGQLYAWSHMRAFWIIYEPPIVKTVHLRFAKKHKQDLILQLGDQSPVEVRKMLLSQLPEWEGKEEAPLDALVRALKL